MTVLVPLVGAVGILLVYAGIVSPSSRRNMVILRIEKLCSEAGAPWSPLRLTLACAGSCVLGALASSMVIPAPVVTAISGLAGVWVPPAILTGRRRRKRAETRLAWPDAIANLVSAARAGVSLGEACSGMSERGPDALKEGFRSFTLTYRATGSFEAACERLKEELADPVTDRVVVALAMAHEVGGTELVRVLRTLGDFIRDDLRVRKEVEARWSWTVTAARIAAASPWLVLGMMSTRPEAAVVYNSALGDGVILGGLCATVAGYRLMLRAARLPEEGRIGE